MRRFSGLGLALVVVLGSGAADASFMMKLDDGATDITIQDQGPMDNNGIPGIIGFSGSLGGISVQVSGQSKPVLGSASSPELQLNLSSATTISGGGVSILLTDTDFSANLPTAMLAVSGGTGGSLNFRSWGDSANQEFGMGFDTGSSLGQTGTFSDSVQTSISNSVGSLTMRMDIGLADAAQSASNVSSNLSLVPEPGTVSLLGFGLAGLAMIGRRRDR